jgi:iron(III) transport system permease protein
MQFSAHRLIRRTGIHFDTRLFILAGAVLIVLYLAGVPLGFLLWGSLKVGDPQSANPPTLENYRQAYTDPGAYQLLLNSVLYALGSSVFSLLLGTMLAWTIERTNLLLSPRIGVINRLLQSILGLSDPLFNVYSLPAMIWVQGLHLSPLVFVTMAAAFRSMDPALEEAAMVSGGSVPTTVRRITLRLLLPAIASMFLIMFIRGLESFEVPALLGLRGGIKVFTSRIWLAIKLDRNFGLAGAFAVTLLVISVAGIILYNRLTARAERFATVTGKAFRPHIIDLGRWRYAAGAFFILYFLLLVGLPLFSFTRCPR